MTIEEIKQAIHTELDAIRAGGPAGTGNAYNDLRTTLCDLADMVGSAETAIKRLQKVLWESPGRPSHDDCIKSLEGRVQKIENLLDDASVRPDEQPDGDHPGIPSEYITDTEGKIEGISVGPDAYPEASTDYTHGPKETPGAEIPATTAHDAGAIARCSYCGTYTKNKRALGDVNPPTCLCGKTAGWSGSFEPPISDSQWLETPDAEQADGNIIYLRDSPEQPDMQHWFGNASDKGPPTEQPSTCPVCGCSEIGSRKPYAVYAVGGVTHYVYCTPAMREDHEKARRWDECVVDGSGIITSEQMRELAEVRAVARRAWKAVHGLLENARQQFTRQEVYAVLHNIVRRRN